MSAKKYKKLKILMRDFNGKPIEVDIETLQLVEKITNLTSDQKTLFAKMLKDEMGGSAKGLIDALEANP